MLAKYIVHQGPVFGALARAAFTAVGKPKGGPAPQVPGPEVVAQLGPRPSDLVRDFVRVCGGDPSAYRSVVPPYLFPQWAVPLAAKTIADVPYPLARILNGGCRLEVKERLPAGKPLIVRAQLESLDDDGRRALLCQHVVTGTAEVPDAIDARIYAVVPLGGGDKKKEKKPAPVVPGGAREIGFWRIGPSAGLDFAMLTGDFNPIHWVKPYARASGFRSCILHGFATMARAWEGLVRGLLAGDATALRVLDARFTRPLTLPAQVGLYVTSEQRVYVGAAPGGTAYLEGSFELRK